nr:type I restriction-modification system subunit M N-terminal domain-containing protein [Helicobacter japonicus]
MRERAKMSEKAIVAKVWNFATILRDSGVSYTEYVAQLSYLLFLKMESERKKHRRK